MFRFIPAIFLAIILLPETPQAGDAGGAIPEAELQALDRAIARELSSGNLGSQTLGELNRLKHRLRRLQDTAKTEAPPAKPAEGDDSLSRLLARLETEAKSGGRAARRSLALYYIFLGEPEKALAQWRAMGKASDYDTSHLLISAFLELALGEYNSARRNLETGLRLMDTRTSLVLSNPVFCVNVGGYRIYEERPPGVLLPGEEVLVYVEVEGAEFRPAQEGGSECDIMFGLKLRTERQTTHWAEPNYGRYSPLFNGPIRDLHAALSWRVPNDLEPGRYYLHVEGLEEWSKRRGEGVIGFTVGKRETNPERRPGSTLPSALRESVIEAGKAFPGAPTPDLPPAGFGQNGPEVFDQKKFELMQRYLQQTKPE